LDGFGMSPEASGEQAEDLAATRLASTLGLDFDPDAAWKVPVCRWREFVVHR
jgi:hypothetical protein